VKFAHLKSFVQNKLGIQHLATGHYARLQQNTMPDGSIEVKLLSGIDPVKDQTYFLSLTPVIYFEYLTFSA
jgi:tRNA-specific 2-thiouridylase